MFLSEREKKILPLFLSEVGVFPHLSAHAPKMKPPKLLQELMMMTMLAVCCGQKIASKEDKLRNDHDDEEVSQNWNIINLQGEANEILLLCPNDNNSR